MGRISAFIIFAIGYFARHLTQEEIIFKVQAIISYYESKINCADRSSFVPVFQ